MEGLTRTESAIVAKYLSRNPPPRAKELALELGVSVKTVYKALYKYRRLYGLSSAPASQEVPNGKTLGREISDLEPLLDALLELKESIDRLNENICKLLHAVTRPSAGELEDLQELPSFVKDNPWLHLISARAE